MRRIVFDVETTGFDPLSGHRIVEIGCVELLYDVPTGKTYQAYINPERDMPQDAFRVHGLSSEFLSKKPTFKKIAGDFLNFIQDSEMIAHNASFDFGFVNAELAAAGFPLLTWDRIIDTLPLARRKFPGAKATLDALCSRFEIDLSRRDKHGALLDSELLAEVYLQLIGGREPGLSLDKKPDKDLKMHVHETKQVHPVRHFDVSKKEVQIHQDFLKKIKNPIWNT